MRYFLSLTMLMLSLAKVKRENGQEDELTNGNFATFMESHDRAVRKAAFEALYKQYGAYINTIAAAFYGNVKQAMFYADARGYKSTLNMYLDGSFIPEMYIRILLRLSMTILTKCTAMLI